MNKKSVIQGQIALKRKEVCAACETRLYFNAYHEISDEVTIFCQQRGISMVMNFNGDAIDPENPDTVARGISNKMVYYKQGGWISRRMHQGAVRASDQCRISINGGWSCRPRSARQTGTARPRISIAVSRVGTDARTLTDPSLRSKRHG